METAHAEVAKSTRAELTPDELARLRTIVASIQAQINEIHNRQPEPEYLGHADALVRSLLNQPTESAA